MAQRWVRGAHDLLETLVKEYPDKNARAELAQLARQVLGDTTKQISARERDDTLAVLDKLPRTAEVDPLVMQCVYTLRRFVQGYASAEDCWDIGFRLEAAGMGRYYRGPKVKPETISFELYGVTARLLRQSASRRGKTVEDLLRERVLDLVVNDRLAM